MDDRDLATIRIVDGVAVFEELPPTHDFAKAAYAATGETEHDRCVGVDRRPLGQSFVSSDGEERCYEHDNGDDDITAYGHESLSRQLEDDVHELIEHFFFVTTLDG